MNALDKARFELDWSQDRSFQVVGMGSNAVDWICVLAEYPRHNTKSQILERLRLGGGQIATAITLCGRYGLQASYIGRVGDDENGCFSLEDLGKEPIDISHMDVVPGAFSQYAFILVDRPTGERTVLWQRDPQLLYKPGELKREWIVQGRLLHMDGHDQAACIQAAQWAREAGMKVCLDIDKFQPGVEDLLPLTDFAVPTIGFTQRFSGKKDWREALLVVSEATPGYVIVTRGKEGAAIMWKGRIIEIPGITVNAVDTTGAGDVFHGAFIYSLFQDWSVESCLQFSNVAAALSCTRYGARGGIPTIEEVLALT